MKRAFEVKEKAFFIIFKGLLVAKNCFRPESVPFSEILVFYAVKALLKCLRKFTEKHLGWSIFLYNCRSTAHVLLILRYF